MLRYFSGTKTASLPCFWVPYIHLGYNALQSGQGGYKWKSRACLHVYLGPSPNYTRSVALVLNLKMGYVLPQFHVKFDDFFKTVSKDRDDPSNIATAEWQFLSGFLSQQGMC